MIENDPRGFGKRTERYEPEPEVHHQHQQPEQEHNAQVEEVQQQVERLGISDNNTAERHSVRASAPEPEPVPAPPRLAEDAGGIRVSVTTTTTVSEANDPTTNATNNPYSNMGLAYNVYLNSGKIYGCRNCKTHLANHEDIISRVSRLPRRPFFPLP